MVSMRNTGKNLELSFNSLDCLAFALSQVFNRASVPLKTRRVPTPQGNLQAMHVKSVEHIPKHAETSHPVGVVVVVRLQRRGTCQLKGVVHVT
ncbi:hypothetical protein TNCV_1417911 [Trichonephila clavipes]|nr:hypothetical protein TNCV_1417911 [Trichonephila clavipes]